MRKSAACRSGVAAAILINPSRIGDAPSSGIVQIELVYLFLRVYARGKCPRRKLVHPQDWVREARKRYVVSERRVTACGRREFAVPTAWGKGSDTHGFYPLDSHFPLFLNLMQTRDRRPLRNGERQRSLSTVGAHSVRPFLYLYAVSDTILLHISATPRRRDIPVSRNSFIWILRTAPANCICPCYSFVHMVGENESQNEKWRMKPFHSPFSITYRSNNRNLRLILFIQMLQIMLCLCRDHAGEQQHSNQVRDGHEGAFRTSAIVHTGRAQARARTQRPR